MSKRLLAFIIFCAIGSAAVGQPTHAVPSTAVREQALSQTKVLLASVDESMSRQQAELEAAISSAAARANWSANDRAKFLQVILRSPTNSAFDEQIASLTKELRGVLQELQQGTPKGTQANSIYTTRVRGLVERLGAVYHQQTSFLTGQLSQVGTRDKPSVLISR